MNNPAIQSETSSESKPIVTPLPSTNPSTSLLEKSKDPAKVTVEIPTSTVLPFNPFDPTWVKLWEQVGPIGYLAMLCLLLWLLTRFVETVKGK